MRASLRRLHSPDVYDLRTLSSLDEQRTIFVQALIGPDNAPGEEAFNFLLVHVSTNSTTKEPHWQKGRLTLPTFDYALLEAAVVQKCAGAVGDTWKDVAEQLSVDMDWEFSGSEYGA